MEKHNCYFLISESKIGVHTKTKDGKNLPFEVFAMSFFPNVIIDSSGEMKFSTELNNDVFDEIVKKYYTLKNDFNVYVLIGFDLDVMGESMSTALRNALMSKRIEEKYIIRTPLTEQGYIAFKEFSNETEYMKYLYHQRQFMQEQKKQGIQKFIGFQKVISLELLSLYGGKETKIDSKISTCTGTSTATVISKFLGAKGVK